MYSGLRERGGFGLKVRLGGADGQSRGAFGDGARVKGGVQKSKRSLAKSGICAL
jgi:hypothetical protein